VSEDQKFTTFDGHNIAYKDNGDPGELDRIFADGKLAIVPGDHNNTYISTVFTVAVMSFVKQQK